MGYFVAYRHTDANPTRLEELLPAVCESLKKVRQEVYCTYFDEKKFQKEGSNASQIMEQAFKKIEEMGGLFVVIDGEEKSEGMLMEVGFCIAKGIKIIVAKRRGINNTYIPSVAAYSFEYTDIEDLKSKIAQEENI